MPIQKNKVNVPKNKLNNQSLPGKASDFIREQIIQGNFEQGSRMVEEELSNSLGVSRACIREALLSLETEGLVIRKRNKYTEVVKFEVKDIEEIFLLRIALELLSAETCITKNSIPLDELRGQMHEITALVDQDPKNYMKRVLADLKFHEIIVSASGNARVFNVWKSIKSQLLTMFYSIPQKYTHYFDMHSAENHIQIINAFETGDISRVTLLIREHIVVTLQYLTK